MGRIAVGISALGGVWVGCHFIIARASWVVRKAGLVVTPQWVGAICALAVECAVPAPQGSIQIVTAISPFAVVGDLFEALSLARRMADLLNGEAPEASWQESGGSALNQSQQSCVAGWLAGYSAYMRLAAAESAQDKDTCAAILGVCMMSAAVGCLAAGLTTSSAAHLHSRAACCRRIGA